MRGSDIDKLNELCDVINYYFKDINILAQAMTHSSFSYETTGSVTASNEVLEFLGDAVINLATANLLIEHFPGSDEGDLSKMRAELVSEHTLAQIAKQIGLYDVLFIGKSARVTSGGIPDSILADGLEALVGAVFRDGGYNTASELVARFLLSFLDDGTLEKGTDYKTRLQEYSQKFYKVLPEYRLEGSKGPDHLRIFESSVWIHGKKMGEGKGRSIKASEQQAALRSLEKLGLVNHGHDDAGK